MTEWNRLRGLPVDRLWAARCQLHWAIQPVTALGKLLIAHQPDYSEQSFSWSASSRTLEQGVVEGPVRFRPALRLSPPTLVLVGEEGSERSLPMAGCTLEQAFAWAARESAALLGRALPGELERPTGLPPHPFSSGAPFDAADSEAFAEMGSLFANADLVLSGWAHGRPQMPRVRCWPHHFDIAALVAFETDAVGEASRSVGVGLVPGDEVIHGPYLYMSPWPPPAQASLPELPYPGRWHREGWCGAVLELEAIAALEAGEQRATVERFVHTAAAYGEQLVLSAGTL